MSHTTAISDNTKKVKKFLALGATMLIAVALFFSTVTVYAQQVPNPLDPLGLTDFDEEFAGDAFDWLTSGGSGGGDATSFTDFQGGLEAPSTEGYSSGLVQVTSGREFIVNIINFVAGFLGLIAMAIIIYGGFLYVTAAGQEEQASKGKKSVTYAVIGILLILGSYAIVNTIILAPSGTDTQGLSGSAPTEGLSTQEQAELRRTLFNVAGTTVQTMATDFIQSYQSYAQTRQALVTFREPFEVRTPADFDAVLSSKITTLNSIDNSSAVFGEVSEIMSEHLTTLQQYQQSTAAAKVEAQSGGIGALISPEAAWLAEYWGQTQSSFTSDLNEIADSIQEASENDFAYRILRTKANVLTLKDQIGNAADLTEVSSAFSGVESALDALASGTIQKASLERVLAFFLPIANAQTNYLIPPGEGGAVITNASLVNPNVSNNDILRIVELFKGLYEAVQNINFVHAEITASTAAGNAPLIVNFDALRSLDPNNQTLTNFTWDFGDGQTGTGVSVSHIYEEPGTYIVRLTAQSPTPDQVADGIAYMPITVRPPVTQINLNANVGGEEYVLRRYEGNSLVADQSVLKLSTSEAAGGFSLDATDTAPTTTEQERLRSVRWSFGNNKPEIVGSGQQLALELDDVTYEEQGQYQLLFEVTDNQNNVDRKIVNVLVGSPVAKMRVEPGNFGNVNDEFVFDAGISKSDAGQISTWEWSYPDSNIAEVVGPTNSDTLRIKFLEPGTHTVGLTITDSIGESDTEEMKVTVESKAPVAQYQYNVPKTSQPAIYAFDGSLSYDPDGEGQLEYKWEVDGQEFGQSFEYLNETNSSSEKPRIKFNELGTYTVALTAIDPDGYGAGLPQEGDIFEQEIVIDNVLDVAWGENDSPSTKLEFNEETGEAQAEISFNVISDNAIAYEMDWGDGEIESGEMNNSITLSHTYKEAGSFPAKVSVFDEEDNENSIARKVFISSDDTPIAVIGLSVNGEQVFDTTEVIQITRTDTVSFDAGESLNIDGTGRRLTYSWDFGNGQRSTQETSNQTFRELGTYEVALKVTNSQDVTQISPTDKVTLEVVGEPPILRSITAVPATGSDLTTPVTVQVAAVGAEDPDGRISRYRWWYYDPNNDNDELGVQITQAPSATITIGTRGDEGQEKTYKFAVEMTDEENNTVSSRDIIGEQQTATLNVTNGPNKAPIASFNVDRTSILVGETINFSSSSTDPDGQIARYLWDFEGDGFANNQESLGSNVSHTFTEGAPNGIQVRLKVIDNNESEATSDPITIYVDALAQDPVAAFTSEQEGETREVSFTDNSVADEAANASIESWEWDFDVNTDSNGDGVKDNDKDALTQNPTHTYPDFGIYRARLTVTDSEGTKSQVTNFVNVKTPMGATGGLTAGTSLDARLTTNPPLSLVDNKIHLKGTAQNITMDFSNSLGNITKYTIDKNIYFDTNGNGINDDDEDYVATEPGKWTSDFLKEWGNIRLRLTVTDATGRTDFVDKDVVFDETSPGSGSSLSTSVLALNDVTIPALLVSGLGFGILTLNTRKKKNK